MAWLQLQVALADQSVQLVELALEEAGALAITLHDAGDQPVLEPAPGATPLWDQVAVTALFDANQPREPVAGLLGSVPGKALQLHWEEVADRAWEREWLSRFSARRYGDRLWVIPSNSKPAPPPAVNVMLDPGLAFGTGDHTTTALCLRFLDERDQAGKQVLDMGCGSGILGIAALLLGAAGVTAIDNDPQALQATRANADANHVGARLTTGAALAGEAGIFDLVVANILAAPLIELAPLLCRMLRPGGQIALSGILHGQADEVAAAYAGEIAWQDVRSEDDWCLLSGRRGTH